jgi:hypothetical protein
MREGWPRAACARPLTGHRFTDSAPPVARASQQFAGSLHVPHESKRIPERAHRSGSEASFDARRISPQRDHPSDGVELELRERSGLPNRQ